MTTRFSFVTMLAAGILLAPVAAPSQSAARPRLDQLMSAQERVATGVSSLTPAQRAELELWLSRYTATVTAVVQGMNGSVGPIERSRSAAVLGPAPRVVEPEGQDTIRPAPRERPRAIPEGIRIYRSASSGTFIMLEDGTMWEILLKDRPAANTWRAGDFVLVEHRNANIDGFRYMLVNPAGRQHATARFAGRIEIRNTSGER